MSTYQQLHQLALQSLLLGTHRRPLPEELTSAMIDLGVETESPVSEQLLEATSILDRLRRTELTALPGLERRPKPPPEETTAPLGPRAARALELALGNTYQPALRELLLLVRDHQARVPPHLIVQLLEIATTLWRAGQPNLANQFLELTGQRGYWLARQHPEWSELLPPLTFEAAYRKLVTPTEKQRLLRQWRGRDPEAARLALVAEWPELSPKQQESRLIALRVGLSAADFPFLRETLKPRRRDVRRLATRLLLLGGESEVTELFTEMASSWLSGPDGASLDPVNEHLPILEDHGFYNKKTGSVASLLANVPPAVWPELLKRSPLDTFSRLLRGNKNLLPELLDATIFYHDTETRQALCRYLLQTNRPQADWTKKTYELYEQLTAEDYQALCVWGLKNVEQVFRTGSVLRQISLQLSHPWPDHFCKLLVEEFTDQLRSRRVYYGFTPNTSWKLLPYRINVQLFPWLRQQLFAATDRSDQVGSVATKMLQVVSFRKAAREAILNKL